jgi:hypothetical protein
MLETQAQQQSALIASLRTNVDELSKEKQDLFGELLQLKSSVAISTENGSQLKTEPSKQLQLSGVEQPSKISSVASPQILPNHQAAENKVLLHRVCAHLQRVVKGPIHKLQSHLLWNFWFRETLVRLSASTVTSGGKLTNLSRNCRKKVVSLLSKLIKVQLL